MKICVATGSRAEYGLLSSLMKLIKQDRDCKLQLLVTGMHLSLEFGLTYKEIEKDGFAIDEKVDMLVSGDSEAAITKSIGIGIIGFADALQRLKPDWLVILGDRFEMLGCAVAAHVAKIPIAHLHGGELSEGATDDAFRHAITKMSFLHFASTEAYRQRVIQLGENPKNVFNVGAIGVDAILNRKLLSQKQVEKDLSVSFDKSTVLVTFHPATLETGLIQMQMQQLFEALTVKKNLQVLFTKSNADAGGRLVNDMIEKFAAERADSVKVFTSLGQLRYYSVLQFVDAVIGNSSSGIIEVPYFNIPTINIGDRQLGRISPVSVIHCDNTSTSIAAAIDMAMSKPFRKKIEKQKQLYGNGNTALSILKTIKANGVPASLKKSFYTL